MNDKARIRVGEIDLFRFVAAIMVVLFHYTFRGHAADDMSPLGFPALAPLSKYGFLGVELFFMISGFVILMTAGNGSLSRFAKSRVVRLYPAYWIGCTLTFLVTMAMAVPVFVVTPQQYLVNMTMLNEFLGVSSIDGVYWSLAVEIRFYVMVAVVLFLGEIQRAQSFLVAWLAVSAAMTTWPFSWTLGTMLGVDYAAYFVIGGMCFLIFSKGWSWGRMAVILAAWVQAMRCVIPKAEDLGHRYAVTYDPWIVSGFITSFVIVMVLVSLRKTGPLKTVSFVAIGALTYPLYLVHQNIGYIIFHKLGAQVEPHVLVFATIALMLFVSHLIHTQLEDPLASRLRAMLESIGQRPVAAKAPHSDSQLH